MSAQLIFVNVSTIRANVHGVWDSGSGGYMYNQATYSIISSICLLDSVVSDEA